MSVNVHAFHSSRFVLEETADAFGRGMGLVSRAEDAKQAKVFSSNFHRQCYKVTLLSKKKKRFLTHVLWKVCNARYQVCLEVCIAFPFIAFTCTEVVTSNCFELLTIFLISSSALQIGLSTNWMAENLVDTTSSEHRALELVPFLAPKQMFESARKSLSTALHVFQHFFVVIFVMVSSPVITSSQGDVPFELLNSDVIARKCFGFFLLGKGLLHYLHS